MIRRRSDVCFFRGEVAEFDHKILKESDSLTSTFGKGC